MNFNFTSNKDRTKIYTMPKFGDPGILDTGYNGLNVIGFDWKSYVDQYATRIISLAYSKDVRAISIVISMGFLKSLEEFISRNPSILDKETLIKWNKIVYDYDRLDGRTEDIRETFINISSMIYQKQILKIKGFNNDFSKETCTMLMVYRESSKDDKIGIKRMTRYMQHSDPQLMTDQVIANIYCMTCGDCISNMFSAVMCDRFDHFYNTAENYIYSTINLVILDIIEQGLTSDDLFKVLSSYLIDINKKEITGRFSLKSINRADYPRINSVIDKLESMGYSIP